MSGLFGRDGYGGSPYGSLSESTSFEVTEALATSSTTVLVTFSFPLNLGFSAFTRTLNYSIAGLSIVRAAFAGPSSIRLTTTHQAFIPYTVSVVAGQSAGGDGLNPLHRTATFQGTPTIPAFNPVGVRKNRIRLAFTEDMLLNPAVLDSASYTVTDIHGGVVAISSVFSEQGASNPRAITLELASDMSSAEWYVVSTSPGIVSVLSGLPFSPSIQKFQWIEPTLNTVISIGKFSGEAKGGLLGDHGGLVYFSPALDAAMAGSVIQIDSVEVCSKAYDEYHLPSPPDPPALFTFAGSAALAGGLNTSAVLWGKFPRLCEASTDVEDVQTEEMPQALDGPAVATMTETYDKSYVALLNDSAWTLFDNSAATTPPIFICANNLGPIPPGPTVITVLQP